MRCAKYLTVVASFALLTPLSLMAADKTSRSITIGDPVTIGSSHLKPGNYKIQWEGVGPNVQVNFMHDGKTVASAPATLKMNDQGVDQDDVIMDRTSAHNEKLKEIDFSRNKEALLFGNSGM